MAAFLLDTPPGSHTGIGGGEPPTADLPPVSEPACPRTLYITLDPDGAFKAGTCAHCVILEPGRPLRAWNADGDRDLDFDRDLLFAHLEDLGIELTHRQAYVCP